MGCEKSEGKGSEEREKKIKKFIEAKRNGQSVVIDLEFAHLMNSSELNSLVQQVFTVNHVVEIILKFLEAKDWKDSFFQAIPQRKRGEADSGDFGGEVEGNDSGEEVENGIIVVNR